MDIHTHLNGISTDRFGTPAELGCLPFGVTATAECGAEKGDRHLLELFRVKSVVFVCTQIHNDHASFAETERLLEAFGNRAAGVKIYFDTTISEVQSITSLKEVCDFARKRNLKVTVHCSHSPVPMSEIVDTLSAGDILTHIYHGGVHNAMTEKFECLKSAQKKGIILDTGHAGYVHTDRDVLLAAAAQSIWPTTISTDLTRLNAYNRGGIYGLTACMSLFRALGMSEEAVLRAVTTSAADTLNQPEWGRLCLNGPADIAVLDERNIDFSLAAEDGKAFQIDRGYKCTLTLLNGEIMYQNE